MVEFEDLPHFLHIPFRLLLQSLFFLMLFSFTLKTLLLNLSILRLLPLRLLFLLWLGLFLILRRSLLYLYPLIK